MAFGWCAPSVRVGAAGLIGVAGADADDHGDGDFMVMMASGRRGRWCCWWRLDASESSAAGGSGETEAARDYERCADGGMKHRESYTKASGSECRCQRSTPKVVAAAAAVAAP